MAGCLLSIQSNGSVDAAAAVPAPAGYILEWGQDQATTDGLEHWTIDVQVAGAVAEWAKGDSYDALWAFLDASVATLDTRPRGTMTVRSRVDPHRVSAVFAYLGTHQLRRAREDLRQRILGVVDAKSRRLKADVELRVHD